MSDAAPLPAPRAARLAAFAVLAILVATVDTRSYGLIPDGKEMLSAAAAVARFFEIGVSRDFINAPRRPAGDAVSRYGMGLSLAEAVPGTATRLLRSAAPSVPSAPIFVLLPIACLVAAAWATGRSTILLGATPGWAAASGAGLVLATPLWGYAASDYGEPLQALCVALAVLGVVELREAPTSRRWQILLGVAAGFAILTKTLLVLAVAPLLACALFGRRKGDFSEGGRARRRAGSLVTSYGPPWPLLLSFAGILFLWVALELVRFGKLFGGYAGETFSYPFFTGLLRLTVLPNKGLFWYAPIVLLAPFGVFELRRRDARLALALASAAASLLLAACAWWAWDGQAGWGPRLLLPALPPLLVFAGLAPSGSARPVRFAGALALVVGTGVNLLGALVPFSAVYALSSVVPPQPIPEQRAEGTEYEIERGADGVLRATAPHHLSLTPSWSPIRVHALLLAAKLRGGVAESLAREGLPQLDPPFRPILPKEPAPAMLLALQPVRVGWGREYFFEGEEEGRLSDPWEDAMRDQTIRAIDMKDYTRAKELGEDLLRQKERGSDSSSDPRIVALIAESIRLGASDVSQQRGAEPRDSSPAATLSYLSKKSSSSSSSSLFLCHPWILFVRSMAAPPGDLSCLPEAQRAGFARGLELASRQGWSLTAWVRVARTGRP